MREHFSEDLKITHVMRAGKGRAHWRFDYMEKNWNSVCVDWKRVEVRLARLPVSVPQMFTEHLLYSRHSDLRLQRHTCQISPPL